MNAYWTFYYLSCGTLGSLRFENPSTLWAELIGKGWDRGTIRRRGGSARLALITPTRRGFSVDLFSSVSSAVRHHNRTVRAALQPCA